MFLGLGEPDARFLCEISSGVDKIVRACVRSAVSNRITFDFSIGETGSVSIAGPISFSGFSGSKEFLTISEGDEVDCMSGVGCEISQDSGIADKCVSKLQTVSNVEGSTCVNSMAR